MAPGTNEQEEHLLSIRPEEQQGEHDRVKEGDYKISIQQLERVSDEGKTILAGVSFQVKAGEVMGIIGPSGSGKSTILRAVNRLWEPPEGSIFVDGEDITKKNVLSVRRLHGMLFQTPMLFDGTVADNVSYGPSLEGKKLSKMEIERLLELADLDPSFAYLSVIGLSGGEAQRVALARTLATKPETLSLLRGPRVHVLDALNILLLDEPTSALDPISTRHIEDTLLELVHRQGLTVLWVSHSLEQVRRISDSVCLVADGVVLEVLKPGELENSHHPVVQSFIAAATQA